MALSPSEISDRIEIQDVLTRYTHAIDQKDWTLLDTCFTGDARLDYTSAGGIAGSYAEVRAWLEQALAAFAFSVHFISNSAVEIAGDSAQARTYVLNPMGFPNPDGSQHVFTLGAFYLDRLVRTPEGWRIAERVEQQAFLDGSLPEALQIPQ